MPAFNMDPSFSVTSWMLPHVRSLDTHFAWRIPTRFSMLLIHTKCGLSGPYGKDEEQNSNYERRLRSAASHASPYLMRCEELCFW